MTNPNRVGLPSRSAKQFRDSGDVMKGFFRALVGSSSRNIWLGLRAILESGLKAIADTWLGHQQARVIGIGLDFLP